MEREETLATFQQITNIEDFSKALEILEKAHWDLDVAVKISMSEGGSTVLPESTNRVSESSPASASAASASSSSSPSPSSSSSSSSPSSSSPSRPVRVTPVRAVNTRRRQTGYLSSLFESLFNLIWNIMSYIPFLRGFVNPNPNPSRLSGFSGRDPNPKAAAHRFLVNYEGKYGGVHPNFFQGSYTQASVKASQELNFLVAYIHCEEHQDTDRFCRQLLPSEEFRSFIHENGIVFWAGDIKEAEPFQVSIALGVSSYPFLGFVGLTQDGRISILGRLDGFTNTSETINKLKQLVTRHEPNLRAERMRKESLEQNRQLRHQQQQEYEQALKADQEREQKEKEEMERKELEKERKRKEEEEAIKLQENIKKSRELKLRSLPEEPPSGKGVTTIRVKLPSGNTLQRRFLETETVQTLYDFVESNELPYTTISLFTNIPKKIYDKKEITLKDAGLCPSVQMFIDGTS